MKILNNIIAFSLIGIALTACDRDFLNVESTDTLTNESLVSDSSLFEDYVINRYMGVQLINKEAEGTPPGFGRGFEYALWSSVCDESIYTNDDNTWLVLQGELSPSNMGITGSIWGRSYRSIRECNYALSIIDQVEMSESHRKKLKGELLFIRAFRYHDLIRNYGGVVLMGDTVLNLDDDFNYDQLYSRSTIEESIDYTVAQLDSAAALLPLENDDDWELGRATEGAALALKARLLLYAASPLYTDGVTDTEKWQEAADAAKVVMNLGVYSLYSDYSSLFLTDENSETIFGRYYAVGARHVCLEIANGPNGYGGWGGNTPSQNLVDVYEMSNGKAIDEDGSGYDDQDPYADRDPRFYATILYNGAAYRDDTVETYTPGGKDSEDGDDNWNTSLTGYYLKKWMDDDNPISNPWEVAGLQPWFYLRYAEVLLNFAEAQNEATGPDNDVYNAINSIRERAGMPDLETGLTQSEMRTHIRRERQVELAFEEHRYYDVRRWEIADETENEPVYGMTITKNDDNSYTYTRKTTLSRLFESQHYWLPIPRDEILASDGMLEQNDGY